MAADPEFIEWQQNRRKNPIGHMVRRTGLRTVYGEPQWQNFRFPTTGDIKCRDQI